MNNLNSPRYLRINVAFKRVVFNILIRVINIRNHLFLTEL